MLRQPRAVGGRRRSDREDFDRCVRALSRSCLTWSADMAPDFAAPADPAAARRASEAVPGIPCDAEGPVFREPWEAQAFAMALALHDKGLFTWPEWAATLGEEIKRAQAAGDPDTGETYYHHWLATLERLVARKGVPPTARRTASQSSSSLKTSAGAAGGPEGRDHARGAGALPRRVGPRRRPHAA